MILLIVFIVAFVLLSMLQFLPQYYIEKFWEFVKTPLFFAAILTSLVFALSGIAETMTLIFNFYKS